MGKGADTKRRMIEETAGLLQRQGLNGTGLADVLEASGLPKGSLYHHFPGGKEELAVAAMKLAEAAVLRRIDRAWESASDLGAFGRELAEGYIRRLQRSDFADGCPVAAVALEGSPVSDALRGASAAALEHWIAAIAAHLEQAGEAPERAQTKATAVIAGLEGALILARATRSEVPMRAVGMELSRLLAG
jgi:TetR/AcrR family transcriptional regulator, lmrAB and yxaGH operons repressor